MLIFRTISAGLKITRKLGLGGVRHQYPCLRGKNRLLLSEFDHILAGNADPAQDYNELLKE